MNIGRKIYYAKSNGLIIWDKGEMSGSVVETTFEQDKAIIPVLAMLPEAEIGVLEYEYGTPMKAAVLVDVKTLALIENENAATIEPIEVKVQLETQLAALEAKIDTMLLKQDEIKAGQVATKEASIAVKK